MMIRSLWAAALVAVAVSSASAAIGDCAWSVRPLEAPNFPKPMPSVIGLPERIDSFWQSMRDLLRPKLGPVVPSELWI